MSEDNPTPNGGPSLAGYGGWFWAVLALAAVYATMYGFIAIAVDSRGLLFCAILWAAVLLAPFLPVIKRYFSVFACLMFMGQTLFGLYALVITYKSGKLFDALKKYDAHHVVHTSAVMFVVGLMLVVPFQAGLYALTSRRLRDVLRASPDISDKIDLLDTGRTFIVDEPKGPQRWLALAFLGIAIAFNVFLVQFFGGLDAVLRSVDATIEKYAGLNKPPEHDEMASKASAGDAYAQFRMGVRYANGADGVAVDINKAIHYYELAVAQGNWKAQYNLGSIYERGTGGIPKDDMKAAQLYQLAADQGDPYAYYSLGLMYESGRGGFTKDHKRAAEYFKASADKGYMYGEYGLATYYYSGDGGLEKDQIKAAALFKKASDQGMADASLALAYMYERGSGGLPVDIDQARMLAQRAVGQGSTEARGYLKHLGVTPGN